MCVCVCGGGVEFTQKSGKEEEKNKQWHNDNDNNNNKNGNEKNNGHLLCAAILLKMLRAQAIIITLSFLGNHQNYFTF